MANSKPKSGSDSKDKKPASVKKAKSPKITSGESTPGENEIRIKAQEIYSERILRGEQGTAEDDWLKAESLLKK
ncbi:MAG: hypothetical protein IPN67_20010 [Bacteroidales bacterium]|nr:hypothetical protein [Bacteroidales bacterium]MBK8884554.1 hypothetical protein [Bacteroidales bacterium]